MKNKNHTILCDYFLSSLQVMLSEKISNFGGRINMSH